MFRARVEAGRSGGETLEHYPPGGGRALPSGAPPRRGAESPPISRAVRAGLRAGPPGGAGGAAGRRLCARPGRGVGETRAALPGRAGLDFRPLGREGPWVSWGFQPALGRGRVPVSLTFRGSSVAVSRRPVRTPCPDVSY